MASRGWEKFSVSDVPSRSVGAVKRSKYKNIKTTVDGIVFDSKREANRYAQLKMRERAGGIVELRRQVVFGLSATSSRPITSPISLHVGTYIADFTYVEDGVFVVEDSKGARTALYLWKKKHMAAQYGIQIRET